jgi:hypothetical protein
MVRLNHDSKGYEVECVVCGRKFWRSHEPGQSEKHECPKSVLAGIKAAETRAWNIDDPLHPAIPRHLDDRCRPLGERLAGRF